MKCPFITKPTDNGVYVEDCLEDECPSWQAGNCEILENIPLDIRRIADALEKIADNMPPQRRV